MTIDVDGMTPDEIEAELRRVIGALSYEVNKAIADDVYKCMHELIRQAALPLDAERERVRVLQEVLMRIDDEVMEAGHWCYDYETAEGKRIADAVHVLWREAREAGLLTLAATDDGGGA
jgi:hypothetical protein